jgi:hypothetical protein
VAQHAKLSASGSAKWMSCPGSVTLEKGLPNPSSEFAAEGTAAHEVATWCLTEKVPAINFLGKKIPVEGWEFEVTHEMVTAVQDYVDFCNNLEGDYEWVEERVEYTNWVKGGFGTSDHIKIQVLNDAKTHDDRHIINVTDLKYGKGVKVSAEWNSQGMIYGLGVLQSLEYMFEFNDHDILNITIVQPRLDHIDIFKISVGDLLEWAEKELKPKAKEALGADPAFHPGEKQCRFCLAKATCKALAADSLKTASEDFSVIGKDFTLRDNKKLTNEQIGELMERIPTLLAWANSIEAYAFEELNKGNTVPGYKLVQGRKKNKAFTIKDGEELVTELLTCGLREDEIYTSKIKTPTQLGAILKANKAGEIETSYFDELWSQADGEPTIAKESDKREAIQPQVKQDFDVVKP